MKRNLRSQLHGVVGLLLWILAGAFSSVSADVVLYNDGTWVVHGIDDTNAAPNYIDVSVAGQAAGSFTELQIFYAYAGGFPQVYSIRGSGELTPIVPPSGDAGGSFHLTGYWDCYTGPPVELRITTLDIVSNTKDFNKLNFTGTLSNGTSLQATDLSLQLEVSDNQNVKLGVRYTLFATRDICVDDWHQEFSEGFQVARISSRYISNQDFDNDGVKVRGIVGKVCDCCSCSKITGSICARFINTTGYLYYYTTRMANDSLLVGHAQAGPRNTPALRIIVKKPSYSKSSAQGYTVFTTDPTTENVNVWINWDKAKSRYAAGKQVGKFQFNLVAELPESVSCDYISQ